MTGFATNAARQRSLSVLFLVALLGAMAMVLDVGSWFREQRATQAAADAAALAAAQELPGNTGSATAMVTSYLRQERRRERRRSRSRRSTWPTTPSP